MSEGMATLTWEDREPTHSVLGHCAASSFPKGASLTVSLQTATLCPSRCSRSTATRKELQSSPSAIGQCGCYQDCETVLWEFGPTANCMLAAWPNGRGLSKNWKQGVRLSWKVVELAASHSLELPRRLWEKRLQSSW